MSTALVIHTYLDDYGHYDRCVRWVKHNRRLYPDLPILAIDNGSNPTSIAAFTNINFGADEQLFVNRLKPKIVRDGLLGYGYTWRAFYEFQHMLETFDRLIFMESDFFICSQRLRDWTLEQDGLVTVHCPKYGFPESALMVLTRHCDEYRRFIAEMPWEQRVGGVIEQVLPFTHVDHSFIGDRYEDGPPPIGCDFAAQVRLEDAVPWNA